MADARVFSFNEMERHLLVPVTDDNMFHVVDLLMAIKDESRSFISSKVTACNTLYLLLLLLLLNCIEFVTCQAGNHSKVG